MGRYLLLLLFPGCIDWSSLYEGVCGDGKVQAGEECDDGNANDDDACLSTCRWATCGDGYVRAGVEECDDGNANDDDGCSNRCLRCDAGNANFIFAEAGYCFSRYDAAVAWADAVSWCDSARGYLTTYVNSHETEAVEMNLLAGVTVPTWIGMDDATKNGAYVWISSEPVQWTKWGNAEPAGPAGGCVFERPASDNPANFVWASAACSTEYGFVCKKAPVLVWNVNHHGYQPLYAHIGWQAASDSCQHAGGHLVTIADQTEQMFVAGLVAGEFWIGGTDKSLDGSFEWVTGEPTEYSSFAFGEPDHMDDAQCLLIGVDDGWHDRPCDEPHAYVCEIEP